MYNVLTKTAIGIGTAILINIFTYYSTSNETERDILLFAATVSCCCAIPILVGYILSVILTKASHIIFYLLTILLLMFNVLLLVVSSTIIYAYMMVLPKLFLGYLICLFTGYYVLYNTTHGVRGINKNTDDFQENILDNNL